MRLGLVGWLFDSAFRAARACGWKQRPRGLPFSGGSCSRGARWSLRVIDRYIDLVGWGPARNNGAHDAGLNVKAINTAFAVDN